MQGGGTGRAALRSFVDRLDQTSRWILLLTYAEGMTDREIGLVLDLPTNRVAARLEQLRQDARQTLLLEHAAVAHVQPAALG